MTDLDGDGSSAVTGVRARGPDGRRLAVSADAVIVATGGFQGNERLLKQYVTDHPEDLRLRANPWSTGDGLLAARDLGAKSTTGLGTFYGHNVAAVPAEFEETEFIDATQYYGPKAVALDKRGRRFTDESESDIEETLAQDTAELVGGRAYLVLDHDLYATRAAGRRIGDMVDRAAAFGGRVAEAETLDGLGTALAEWGVQGTRAVETIREFNDSLHGGRPGTLDPPRSDHRNPVDSPPFRAVEVQAGITMTMGGLDVTERMEVLRRTESGTTIEHPRTEAVRTDARRIAGLYGAGADVGNVSHRRYLGGMAQALVTGRIAAANAVDRVT